MLFEKRVQPECPQRIISSSDTYLSNYHPLFPVRDQMNAVEGPKEKFEWMKWSKFVQGEGYDCTTNKINGDGLWSRWCHSSFVFSRKYFTLTISVAAQHKWILRQLQPGGGKGFCSCARYICDILMQFLATKVTHVDALEVRWDTIERMGRRAWGFECSGVYVGTKL